MVPFDTIVDEASWNRLITGFRGIRYYGVLADILENTSVEDVNRTIGKTAAKSLVTLSREDRDFERREMVDGVDLIAYFVNVEHRLSKMPTSIRTDCVLNVLVLVWKNLGKLATLNAISGRDVDHLLKVFVQMIYLKMQWLR